MVFGKETDDESTRLVADCSESVGPEAVEYLMDVLDFIAWRRASRASVEDMVFSERREPQGQGTYARCHVGTARIRYVSRGCGRQGIKSKFFA